jgi:hypothetical protein
MDISSAEKHKFLADSEMTFEQVYNFAFRGLLVPLLKNLSKEYGPGFIEALKRAASETAARSQQQSAESVPKQDLSAFTSYLRVTNRFWRHVLTFDVVEDTETAVEVKVTECLWAKTFREADAAEIGYATICYPDFAMCQAFNPKIRLTRSKTLMQGDDCCDHRWVWDG